MPTETHREQPARNDDTPREDGPIPSASDEEVLDETTRMAREGRKELESDPKEPKRGAD